MSKRVMIALGGNAITQPHEKGTFEEQMTNVGTAAQQIAKIALNGYEIVITHGNGPQVGNLAIQQEQGVHMVPAQPLFVLGSMTQGQIGYMMQQNLNNLLSDEGKEVATIITQVIVSKDDPDFQDPTKPVGPYYDEETAKRLGAENDWLVKKVRPSGDKPWRRVVPSPKPLGIAEASVIKKLVEDGTIVIASGGGGIPVFRNGEGNLEGVDAVIDKDRAGAKLAEEVGANIYLILTDVEHALLNYGTDKEEPVKEMTVDQAKKYQAEGHFKAGSMGPKVWAALGFVERGGEHAIITSLDKAVDALEGKTGTHIVPN
ncbi:MAG: carbamate kinase [Candidatus Bathyarchaeota archaeon]|nr:carbamate kinase [Candidatus Bathyarchaeota archaeon]